MKTIKVGIIGCGARIRAVADKLIKTCPKISLHSLCDISKESIEQSKVLFPQAEICQSYEAMLADPEVSWILVGSYNGLHKEHVVKAFEAGKHVFCEKPLATTLEDCIAMRDAWENSDSKFNIGFVLRYSPFYRKIKELIDAGIIGSIINMEANETIDPDHGGAIMGNWRNNAELSGSSILEKCTHDLDILNWLTQSKPIKVAAFSSLDFFIPENAHLIERLGKNEKGESIYLDRAQHYVGSSVTPQNPFTCKKDVTDNYSIIIQYENGSRSTFSYNCNSAIPERRIHICGSRGTIRGDLRSGLIEWAEIQNDRDWDTSDWTKHVHKYHAYEDVNNGHGGGDEVLAKELGDCMLGDAKPYVSLQEGLYSAFAAFGIDEAVATSQVVHMDKYWKKITTQQAESGCRI
jgi:predicted dehydrogenase